MIGRRRGHRPLSFMHRATWRVVPGNDLDEVLPDGRLVGHEVLPPARSRSGRPASPQRRSPTNISSEPVSTEQVGFRALDAGERTRRDRDRCARVAAVTARLTDGGARVDRGRRPRRKARGRAAGPQPSSRRLRGLEHARRRDRRRRRSVLAGLTREVEEETGLVVSEWEGPLYEVRASAPDLGWRMRCEVHRAVAFEGRCGSTIPTASSSRPVLPADRVETASPCRRWVREPLAEWLRERWAPRPARLTLRRARHDAHVSRRTARRERAPTERA